MNIWQIDILSQENAKHHSLEGSCILSKKKSVVRSLETGIVVLEVTLYEMLVITQWHSLCLFLS